MKKPWLLVFGVLGLLLAVLTVKKISKKKKVKL